MRAARSSAERRIYDPGGSAQRRVFKDDQDPKVVVYFVHGDASSARFFEGATPAPDLGAFGAPEKTLLDATHRAARDFGDPKFGQASEQARFVERCVDLLGRSLKASQDSDSREAPHTYLTEKRTGSADLLARKAVVPIKPTERAGDVIRSDHVGPIT